MPELLTMTETAAALRLSVWTAYRMARDGRIPAIRAGRSLRVRREVVQRLARTGIPAHPPALPVEEPA